MSGEDEASELRRRLKDAQTQLDLRTREVAELLKTSTTLGLALADLKTAHSLCVECGPNVGVNEDGLCATCGATCTGAWLDTLRVSLESVVVPA